MVKVKIFISIIVPKELVAQNDYNPIIRLDSFEKEFQICPQIGDMIEIFDDGILETVKNRYITNKGIEIPITGKYSDLEYYEEQIKSKLK